MPSKADIVRLSRANKKLVRMAEADLLAVWPKFDLTKPASVRDALLEVVPALAAKYGDLGGAMTAEWLETLRETKVGTTGLVTVSPSADRVAVESTVRAFAGHLWTDDPTATLNAAVTALGRYVRQPGRDTVAHAVQNDPKSPRWARVTTKAKPCEFCLMLAQRGAVYLSEESAGAYNAWHGGCGCEAVPVYAGDEAPESLAA